METWGHDIGQAGGCKRAKHRAMAEKGKRKRARVGCAIGLVELVDIEEALTNLKAQLVAKIPTKRNPETPLPHVWVNIHAKDPALPWEAQCPSPSLGREAQHGPAHQNVIGIIEAQTPTEKRIRHLLRPLRPHWHRASQCRGRFHLHNGARDNGIGVTAVLSMAETQPNTLQAFGPVHFFTGRNWGCWAVATTWSTRSFP